MEAQGGEWCQIRRPPCPDGIPPAASFWRNGDTFVAIAGELAWVWGKGRSPTIVLDADDPDFAVRNAVEDGGFAARVVTLLLRKGGDLCTGDLAKARPRGLIPGEALARLADRGLLVCHRRPRSPRLYWSLVPEVPLERVRPC